MARLNGDRSHKHGDIARHLSLHMHRAESASHIARRLSLSDVDIGAEAGAVITVRTLRKGWRGKHQKQSGGKQAAIDVSNHRDLSGEYAASAGPEQTIPPKLPRTAGQSLYECYP